jgi:ABC-type transporter Mla subunit MlaD
MTTHPAPAVLADQAAEAVRGLNHATQHVMGELTYPSDAYDVVASLKTLTQRLPQTFAQLGAFMERLGKTGNVTADYGDADEHVGEARSALASAALIAQTLTEHLDRAHSALAPLGYSVTDDQ